MTSLSCCVASIASFIAASLLFWSLASFQSTSFDPQRHKEGLQTEIVLGVPVHSYYSDGSEGRRLRQDQEKDWVIVLGEANCAKTENAAISGHNRERLVGQTVASCTHACRAKSWCKSFDYHKKQGKCDLSDKSESGVGLKTNYAGNPYDHYDCTRDKKAETSRRICKAGGRCRWSNDRFVVVRATKKELEKMLKSHGQEVAFVEEDAPMFVVPEIPRATTNKAARAPGVRSWGLDRIDDHHGLDNHYDALYTGAGVHVYVMDTGIRTTHEDFGGRAIPTLEVSGHHDEPDGIKACDGDATCANDLHGHGTHCAATAGGRNYGVAPFATLHAVKVFKDCATCDNKLEGKWSWFVEALDWVVARGERPAVVSASIGGPNFGGSLFVQMAVRQAVDYGVTVVVAAGNNNRDACKYSPASFSEAITVGATNQEDARSTGWGNDGTQGSNWGSCIDLFAPGSEITSAGIASDTSQAIMDGTSMAAPHVAGAAALLLHKKSWLTPKEVMSTLILEATSGVVTDRKGSADYLLYVGREPCAFLPHQDTAVKGQGTGGEKLKRSDYESDLAYLNACSIACREDSTCNGFVDDPTDRRGRMCKPKKASNGYRREGKTFHVKGVEC